MAGGFFARKRFSPPTWQGRNCHQPLPFTESARGETHMIKLHLNIPRLLFSSGLETRWAMGHQRARKIYVLRWSFDHRYQKLNGARYTKEQMAASSRACSKRWPHTKNEDQTRLNVYYKSCWEQGKVYDTTRSINLHHQKVSIL